MLSPPLSSRPEQRRLLSLRSGGTVASSQLRRDRLNRITDAARCHFHRTDSLPTIPGINLLVGPAYRLLITDY